MQAGSAGNTGNVVFAPTGAAALTVDTTINVAAGTLTAGNNELSFMTSIAASTTVASGATLNFQDNLSSGGINALFGAGTVNTGTNSATSLTVNSGTFAGNIAGSGALVKQSAGTLTLSGQNAFIGGTTVNAGKLVVDGDLSFGLGEVTVNSGGTLGGSGIVGTVTLNGGSVSPGSSPGTLTVQNLFWQDGLLVFELGPTTDLLNITGALQGFGTNYGFSFVDAGWTEGATYTLANYFTNMIAVDDFYYVNGGGFAGTFTDTGSSLQFTVTTVPEPSTWSLLACAVALGWLLAARRKRVGVRDSSGRAT
jgi:autotransporter-associated beta strand protein